MYSLDIQSLAPPEPGSVPEYIALTKHRVCLQGGNILVGEMDETIQINKIITGTVCFATTLVLTM